MTPDNQTRLLKLAAKYDATDMLKWHEDLTFYVICNDVFGWACADAEHIKESEIQSLEQALTDAGDEQGIYLWVARKRKLRPQGAMYKYFTPKQVELFDACGPVRQTGMFNPIKS